MRFLVTATTQSPLALRVGRTNKQEGTLGYIPGSALLGALAAAHRYLRADKQDEFAAFFLQEKVLFGNLYPAHFSKADRARNPLDDERVPVYPIPRTARSCKRFIGFRFHADEDSDKRHGVWDSLIAWTAFALSGETDLGVLDSLRDCPSCGEPFDSFTGFYRRGGERMWGAAEARRGMFTRTGIDRKRNVVSEGILYSREFMHEGSQFCGEWWVDDALVSTFETFLEHASDNALRIGHNRSRGLGKLSCELRKTLAPEAPELIQHRAHTFNSTSRELAKAEGFFLPVTLTSDCIIPDAVGRYHGQLAPEILTGYGCGHAELVYTNASLRRISGWNSLWGLPKADEWAMTMGSVFLFRFDSEPDFGILAQLQERGLGSRRSEGFGRVRIADAFHQEVQGA